MVIHYLWILSNSFASGNGAVGIWLYMVEDFNVHDCVTLLNTGSGIEIDSGKRVNLINIISKNNLFGMLTKNCNDILLTNCQFYDDREPPLQNYGIYLYETNIGISLVNCTLSPNEIKDIYNLPKLVNCLHDKLFDEGNLNNFPKIDTFEDYTDEVIEYINKWKE